MTRFRLTQAKTQTITGYLEYKNCVKISVVNMLYATEAALPTSISMTNIFCLVKQAYEHDKCVAFLKKHVHKINQIFTGLDNKTKKMASSPVSFDTWFEIA